MQYTLRFCPDDQPHLAVLRGLLASHNISADTPEAVIDEATKMAITEANLEHADYHLSIHWSWSPDADPNGDPDQGALILTSPDDVEYQIAEYVDFSEYFYFFAAFLKRYLPVRRNKEKR